MRDARRRGGSAFCTICTMARILVIEDEDDLRALAQHALESEGHKVIPAADGAQGLALQRERAADVVITDIYMPEKEGIETIQELKQEFPRVKVIAMSGGGSGGRPLSNLESLSTTANALGIDAFLRKPFDFRTLLESVRHVLQEPTG
jgi:CheY-like chemotaxis protein